MIGYVTLGSNDIARTGEFYDALLGEIGATRQTDGETFVAWSVTPGTPMLWVIKPFDGAPATVGNGVMVALAVDSKDHVERLHAKAPLGCAAIRSTAPTSATLMGTSWRCSTKHI